MSVQRSVFSVQCSAFSGQRSAVSVQRIAVNLNAVRCPLYATLSLNATLSLYAILLFLCFSTPLFAQTSRPLSGLNVEGLREEKGKELRWQDNPFVQPVESLDVQDLRLTAVVKSENEAICLINGEALRVGDKIGFSEVVHIEKDRVVLRNENGIFSLSLKGNIPQTQATPTVVPATKTEETDER